jgi:hypothetical protein
MPLPDTSRHDGLDAPQVEIIIANIMLRNEKSRYAADCPGKRPDGTPDAPRMTEPDGRIRAPRPGTVGKFLSSAGLTLHGFVPRFGERVFFEEVLTTGVGAG